MLYFISFIEDSLLLKAMVILLLVSVTLVAGLAEAHFYLLMLLLA